MLYHAELYIYISTQTPSPKSLFQHFMQTVFADLRKARPPSAFLCTLNESRGLRPEMKYTNAFRGLRPDLKKNEWQISELRLSQRAVLVFVSRAQVRETNIDV